MNQGCDFHSVKRILIPDSSALWWYMLLLILWYHFDGDSKNISKCYVFCLELIFSLGTLEYSSVFDSYLQNDKILCFQSRDELVKKLAHSNKYFSLIRVLNILLISIHQLKLTFVASCIYIPTLIQAQNLACSTPSMDVKFWDVKI